MNYLSLTLAFGTAAGVLMAVWALLPRTTAADVAESRLRAYESARTTAFAAEPELEKRFRDRVLRPAIQRIGHFFEQTMPDNARRRIQLQLQVAGNPGHLTTGDFIAWRYVFTVLMCAAGLAAGLFTRNGILIAVGAAVGGAAGLYLPILWLRQRVSQRRDDIRTQLPDVIDTLVVCMEAGLTFEASMEKVVEKYDHALAQEFGRVLDETRLGKPRLSALNDMSTRLGVDELNNFVQAIIQSQQLGAGIARILRIQSEEIRHRRLMVAQERGGKASLKMLLPMIGCIFPTLWVILLGPAALMALRVLNGGG